MNCSVCGKVFEAKRADAKYCSDKCRKSDKRKKIKADSVRDNVSVTLPGDKDYSGVCKPAMAM